MQKKNKVLFINDVKGLLNEAIARLEKELGYKVAPIVVRDSSVQSVFSAEVPKGFSEVQLNFNDESAIQKYAELIKDEVLLITCRTEQSMVQYLKIAKYFPELPSPSPESVMAALSKDETRRIMSKMHPRLSVAHSVIDSSAPSELERAIKKVGFPCIVKPTGLDSSMLVQKCTNMEELEASVKKIEDKIKQLYDTMKGRGEASIILEQLITGEMYSLDVFVRPDGQKLFCPLTRVITGDEIGKDDFYGYIRRTPIDIDDAELHKAKQAAEQSIDALGLRSTTCHVEMFHTEKGWKLIEIGPRSGGYRDQMHTMSVGIPYAYNDLATRTQNLEPDVNPTKKDYAVVINLYPTSEGKLRESVDEKLVKDLGSYYGHKVRYKSGDHIAPAKFGGKPVLSVTLIHESIKVVEADISTIEKFIKVEV